MGIEGVNSASAAPVAMSLSLRPLDRQRVAAASALARGDRFQGRTTEPRGAARPLVPLATLNGQGVPEAPPTLSQNFDRLPTVGGGEARVRLQPRNTDSWNARWDMLTNAHDTIDASYFSLEKDVYGYAMLGALLKKQVEGVKVRVITDAAADSLGTRGFVTPFRGRDYLQELVNHGAEAYNYNPIQGRLGLLTRSQYAVLASTHDKILVVDGQRSITGGRNIGIDYLTEPADRKGAWRDMDVEITGAGPARGMTEAFNAELGTGSVARPMRRDRFGNWDKKDIQLLGAYEMMNIWLHEPALSASQKAALRANPSGRQAMATDLMNRALQNVQRDLPAGDRREPSRADREKLTELANQLVDQLEARGSQRTYQASRLTEHNADVRIIDQTSAGALHRTNGIAPALLSLVQSAQKHIVIENPYVVLTETMLHAMERASARGVTIDIITNSPLSTDSAVTQAFFLEDWQQVLARCPNARIFVATGDRKFHTKSAVVDNEVSFVSTYNLDLLSGKVNSEVGALVRSPEMAADLLHQFDLDKADPANGFLEYRIKKDADGNAILRDGKPIPEFGPENHLPRAVLDDYAGRRHFWGHTLRDNLPYFRPLRHPERLDGLLPTR